MGREELRAALEELTASLGAADLRDGAESVDPHDGATPDQLARIDLLEELRGL